MNDEFEPRHNELSESSNRLVIFIRSDLSQIRILFCAQSYLLPWSLVRTTRAEYALEMEMEM